jgi:competence protein ComGC
MISKADKFWMEHKGATLFELIIVIILIGVTLPSILGLMSQITVNHLKNEILNGCASRANSKMEEIVVFKNNNDLWYDSMSTFVGDEVLSGGYQRTVTLTKTTDWLSTGFETYQINVTISHPNIPNSYTITRIFIK